MCKPLNTTAQSHTSRAFIWHTADNRIELGRTTHLQSDQMTQRSENGTIEWPESVD